MNRSGSDSAERDEVLRLNAISKTFAGLTVLHDVNLALRRGEIRSLVGENGSGKSTLVKIMAGYHEPDAGGSLHVSGVEVPTHEPGAAGEAGLRFVHQDLGLVAELSTVENLGLGRGYGGPPGAPVRWGRRRTEAREMLLGLGYDVDVDVPVGWLQASERTAVAVARAIMPSRSATSVLVLDEPTANLPGPEVERLFTLVRNIRDRGIAVLFISHHLAEVFDLADTVTVLRGGHMVSTVDVASLDEDRLIELMMGRHVDRSPVVTSSPKEGVVLDVVGLSGAEVRGVDFQVRSGEIVGIAGITGSGREELASLLFGAAPRRGTVMLSGHEVPPGRPYESRERGMALVSSDRNARAVLHGHTVAENLTIARLRDFSARGRMRRRAERAEVAVWLDRLDVRPRRTDMPIAALSGGNTQKVMMARWLRLDPALLLLDEPTQGVDIGAKEDIHQRIEDAAARGAAVLVCSTDNEELARICHRVLVMVRGHVAAALTSPVIPDTITARAIADTQEAR